MTRFVARLKRLLRLLMVSPPYTVGYTVGLAIAFLWTRSSGWWQLCGFGLLMLSAAGCFMALAERLDAWMHSDDQRSGDRL